MKTGFIDPFYCHFAVNSTKISSQISSIVETAQINMASQLAANVNYNEIGFYGAVLTVESKFIPLIQNSQSWRC